MHSNGPFSMSGPQQHHGARPRRGARFAPSQASSKPSKPLRPIREPAEVAQFAALRKDFEAARSFDLDDDEVFCPWHLLTDDDVCFDRQESYSPAQDLQALRQLQSINSSSSDRSSSSGGSPDSSPMQAQTQPTPTFALSATANPHMPSSSMQQHAGGHLKIHQPLAQRTRNAIPIVDPNSRHTSPPTSVSPARQVQKSSYIPGRRW